MRALVKTEPTAGLELADVPLPTVGRHDVLIRVLRAGICGTDRHIYTWDRWAAQVVNVPRVIGHEFVGEIVEAGAGVGALRPGDLVSGEGHVTCGQCAACNADDRHLCPDVESVGIQRDGAFAEYIALPEKNVWVHREGTSLECGVLFDPLGNAIHVATSCAVRDKTVLIAGAGPIGIMAAAVAVQQGAGLVAVSDHSEERLRLAKAAGAHHTVTAAPGAIAELTLGLGLKSGFDVGFEMSGSAAALTELLEALAYGGQAAVLGLYDQPVATDWSVIVTRMLTVRGISGRRVFDTWHTASSLVTDGLDLTFLISHEYAPREFEAAFTALAQGDAGKVIFNWEAADHQADPS